MAPKILHTGVTGYIGGDAFYALYSAHPEFEYTLIVRNEDRAKLVREKYPNIDKIRIVYGTPGTSYLEVLEEEAAKADVIIHTAESADDVPSATAISKGVLKAEGRSAKNPVFWVHVSGTGILQWYDLVNKRFGQPPLPSETYDDINDIPRLITLPDEAMHRDVDKIVLATNHNSQAVGGEGSVKTAVVAPCTIYGQGRGPVNTTSQQLPNLARFVLQHKFAPSVGTGKVEWDNIHIHDVSALLTRLVEIAALEPDRAAGLVGEDGKELFGNQAYFFFENGTPHVWADIALKVAQEAVRQGFIKEAVTKTVSFEEVPDKSWGMNSRSVASRAKKYLDLTPKGPSLEDEIPAAVATEAKRLGLSKDSE